MDASLLPAGDGWEDSLSALAELTTDGCDTPEGALGEVTELPNSTSLLRPLTESKELVGDALSLAWLSLLASLGEVDDVPLASDEATSELGTDDSVELVEDVAETLSTLAELTTDDCDGPLCEATELADWPSLLLSLIEPTELVGETLSLLGPDDLGLAIDDSPEASDDLVLNEDNWLATLDAGLDDADEIGEAGDDDVADGRLEASLGVDDPLGWDDGLLIDEPEGLPLNDFDGRPLENPDPSLSDERLSDDGDDVGDEPLLFDFEDRDEERAEGVDAELRDSDDVLSDDPDELRCELLRSELLGELFDELSEDPIERDRLLDDGTDDTGLLEELSTELLSDESLDELGDDRDDSLTLENDLLDP